MSDDDLFGRAEIDALFGLDPSDFVARRKEVARALRKSGERDVASRVDGIAKPSASVFALNRVARTDAGALARALAALDAKRDAQLGGAQGGPDAGAMRRAGEEARRATADLRAALASALTGAGHAAGRAILDRAIRTLEGAALDAPARQRLVAGCLRQDVEPVGFEGLSALADLSVLAAGPKESARPAAPTDAAPTDEEARAKAKAIADARARERAIADARDAVARLEQARAGAQRDLADADRRVTEARRALELAERDEATAKRRLEERTGELRIAEDALQRLLGAG